MGLDCRTCNVYIEAVHRLNDLGAVVTHAAHGTSQEGFDAEWRGVDIFTVEGDLINRCELFDEADLDAALARFDELSRPAPRLENAASQVYERFLAHFAARDWDAMAEILADDFLQRRSASGHQRRNPPRSRCRDREHAGGRRSRRRTSRSTSSRPAGSASSSLVPASRIGRAAEAFLAEVLGLVETDADERIAAVIVFDLDDIDAAFAELDARYLAGEAAAHAHTWSVIAQAYAALNRHEMPPTTPDWVNIDHRRGTAFAPGDLTAYLRPRGTSHQTSSSYVEAVHRLNNLGAVVSSRGAWDLARGLRRRVAGIDVLTVDGDLINRCEVFDEADLDAALARFDQLSRPAPRLENAASRVDRALPGVLRGPRLGRHGRDSGRRHYPPTIAVGW